MMTMMVVLLRTVKRLVKVVWGQDDGIDDDPDDGARDGDPADVILRDYCYRLKCMCMEKDRGLKVKNAVANFDQATLYGNRTAFHELLLVTSKEASPFHKSKLWKQAAVFNISMLPRSEMAKPPRDDSKYGSEARFTKVQEMKQYCGGISFIAKIVEALQISGGAEYPTILLDMLGFDGWVAKHCLYQCARGKKFACATVCHTSSEAAFVSNIIGTQLFSMARSGEYRLAGFPDFQAAVSDLKQFQRAPMPEYQVCVGLADGTLVIRQSLVDFWSLKHAAFKDKMDSLLEAHNAEFNKRGIKRGADESNDSAGNGSEPPAKRLCLDSSKTTEELESEHPERTTLQCGDFALTLGSDESLWVGSGEETTVEEKTELWGFGSGDFEKGSSAKDIMSDAASRWVLYALTNSSDIVILEKGRRTPEHLEDLTWNQVISLGELMRSLEDRGEVGYSVAEHRITKNEAGTSFTIEPLESVVFALDPVKPRKKKAKATSALSFGAKLNFSKLRSTSNIKIIWRLRLLAYAQSSCGFL
ncbi:Uncharacterized protein SCF082_LOCUS4551 [Durusdinium trenchii]|uniref:Uncharacterized protein n=1 Tax=Durusdinium trenchii TaxID=1381693 RepID=A0ABP0I020_9DINO